MKISRRFARLRLPAPRRRATPTARLALVALAGLLPLAAPTLLHAQTWDGSGSTGGNLNWSFATNWNTDTAPLNNGTANVIFSGGFDNNPGPNLDQNWSVQSVTFNDPANAFVLGSTTNAVLTVGSGGIVNNAAETNTVTHLVSFSGASVINAAAGALVFSGTVGLGSTALSVTGNGDTSFANITGTGSVTKSGAGTMTWAPTVTTSADIIVNAGTLSTVADGSTDTLNSSASIAVNGTSALSILENMVLDAGAQLTRAAGGTVSIDSGKTLTIQGGSDFITTGDLNITFGNITVSGGGSTLQTLSGGSFSSWGTLAVQSGGTVSVAGELDVNHGDTTVDGLGSSLSTPGVFHVGGFNRDPTATFSNNATGTFGEVVIAHDRFTGFVQVLTGADVTIHGNLRIGTLDDGAIFSSGSLTVNGLGSTWTQTGATSMTIGSDQVGAPASILNVQNGGVFVTGTGSVTLNPTAVVNIDGGVLILSGPLVRNGGALNFNSGGLSFVNNWNVGTGGLLGTNVTLDATRRMTTTGTTTVDAYNTLTLNGGSLNTAALLNNGTLAFLSGSLGITGTAGFNIGTGALGANVTLGAGTTLKVTNTATIASGATLTVNGGTFTAGSLANSGTLRAPLGQATTGAVTNASSGRIFIGAALTDNGAWTNAAGSRLTLENGGLVTGVGAITNSGLVTGDGTIATGFNNASGGEARGEAGATLTFTGTTGANAGRLNLLGGTLQFAKTFTNAAAGQITGAGALFFPTTPVPTSASPNAGLMNAGSLNFSGGNPQIYGTVQMQAGSQLIVSGGATATFYDVFRHSGLTVKADAGSNLVFFGEVRGGGSFTGSGTVSFDGGYTPGNSPALVTFDNEVVFGGTSALTLEIGGLVAGTQYDRLEIAQKLVEGGALDLTLYGGYVPHLGDHFDFFDAGTIAGHFDTVNLPALSAGLAWDSTSLQTNGQLTVVPEPTTGALLVSGLALAGLRRRRRQNQNESAPMKTNVPHLLGSRPAAFLFTPLALILCLVFTSLVPAHGANTFASTGSLATARYHHTETLLPSGKVLVAGGADNNFSSLASAELYDPASGTWTATGSLGAAHVYHTATLLPNGKVLVAGGGSSSAELYDPASGTWTATGSLAKARDSHTATLLPNGKVLVAGGQGAYGTSLSAELYDPASEKWTATGSLVTGRDSHTATLLPNGKVLVAGGFNNDSFSLSSAELYDPAGNGGAGTWTATTPLATARSVHTATLLPNGKVLVAGGFDDSGALSSAELYDPLSMTWTATSGALATARGEHTATLLPNGKVLVAGGLGNSGYLASAELYDPLTGGWTPTTGPLATARSFLTATLLANGKVLVAGGQGGPNGLTVFANAELYDSAGGAWTPTTGSLATARSSHTSTLLPNGKVLAAGGVDINGAALASAELYNPANGGTWAPAGSFALARYGHTATLLSNGKVLVAGGVGASYLTSAQLYDPASGTWAATGSLATARYYHTATLLSNGKVLVAGGRDSNFNPLASAELYDPASGTWAPTAPFTVSARASHTATLLPNGKVLVAGGAGTTGLVTGAELYDPVHATWTPTGNLTTARYIHTATLLPNGKVLVAGGLGTAAIATAELYNPASELWTPTGSLAAARYRHTATLLPNGQVLVAGGTDVYSLASAQLYDPASGAWATIPSMVAPRSGHTATLLASGKVLIAAGYNGDVSVASAELYDVGLGFLAAWQPQITSASFNASGKLVLTGTGFKGLSGGSGGNTQDSPTNYPIVQLRRLGNDQSVFLSLDSSSSLSVTAFTSVLVPAFSGYAVVTVFASGIPSAGVIVRFTGSGADFNGDGNFDLVIYNPSIQTSKIEFLRGSTYTGTATGPAIPAGWNLVKARDFDNDGKADLFLFKPSTGDVSLWTMNGITPATFTRLTPLPAGWQIAAVADLNADGYQDLVLFNPGTRGQAVWLYTGATLLRYSYIAQAGVRLTIPAGYTIAAAADFNGDGKPDLLLYNPTTRQTMAWYLNGTSYSSQATGPTLSAGGALAGAADFNGDGKPDLLVLETATRKMHIGFLSGLTVTGSANVVDGTSVSLVQPAGYNIVAP